MKPEPIKPIKPIADDNRARRVPAAPAEAGAAASLLRGATVVQAQKPRTPHRDRRHRVTPEQSLLEGAVAIPPR